LIKQRNNKVSLQYLDHGMRILHYAVEFISHKNQKILMLYMIKYAVFLL